MHRGITMAVAIFLALAGQAAWAGATDADAGTDGSCVLRVERDGGVTTIAAGAWEGECRAGRGCAIRGPEVAGARLQLSHPLEEKQWQVVVTLPEPADAAEGVELVVDDGAPMRVPYEFLDVRADGRALAIRPEVVDVVLDALKRGRRLEWRYVRKGGAARKAVFDIACLGAEGLFTATEKRLATMRAMKRLGK